MTLCLGLIGLGRMGRGLTQRWCEAGIRVHGVDLDPAQRTAFAALGGVPAADVGEMIAALPPPRLVWCMLPAGNTTRTQIAELARRLAPGDLVVDGANGNYRDALEHHQKLGAAGIDFADAGVSGGVWGARLGFCLMLGGSAAAISRLQPFVVPLAATGGIQHCGPAGAGHYVKMIHNGIEYGLMQAYAECFSLLGEQAPFVIDRAAVAAVWQNGSVVRSWLLDLIGQALAADPDLSTIAPYVEDSGHGRGTVTAAIEQGIPAPVLGAALNARFASRGGADYAAK